MPLIKHDIKSMEDQKRNEVMYYASFLAGAMGKEFINDNISSIFCGIAPTMFDNGIVADINVSQQGCFVYIFRNATFQDKRPIIDSCIERWIRLFVEK